MPDTMKIADDLRAAGFNDRQARAIVGAQTETVADHATKSELEKIIARLDGMDRWLKFIAIGAAVGVAAVILKLFLG